MLLGENIIAIQVSKYLAVLDSYVYHYTTLYIKSQ